MAPPDTSQSPSAAPPAQHPAPIHPALPLVFTVAVTGHQDIPAASHADLQAQLSALLAQAQSGLRERRAANAVDAGRETGFRFVSALAPGADQIGANAALDAQKAGDDPWALHVILPFAQATCKTLAGKALAKREVDAAAAAAAVAAIDELAGKATQVLELSDWQPADPAANSQARDGYWESRRYATLGRMLVRQADLLIALWDGEPPRGRGGTADVVSEARRSGVPVVWIKPKEPDFVRSLLPDPATSHVPANDLVARCEGEAQRFADAVANGSDEALARSVGNVLLGDDEARFACVQRYLDEPPAVMWTPLPSPRDPEPAPEPGDTFRSYEWLRYLFLLFARRHLPPGSLREGEKEPPLRSFPFRWARREGGKRRRFANLYKYWNGVPGGQEGTANDAPLLEHAERADALAMRLSNQYRSAYVLIFGFAAVAVHWAVLSALFPDWKWLLVIFELLTVAYAAFVFLRTCAHDPVEHTQARGPARTRLQRWHRRAGVALRRLGWTLCRKWNFRQDTHQRWLDARLIAESQRSGRLLAWAGMVGRRPLDDAATAKKDTQHGHEGGDDGEEHDHAPPRTVWAPHYANAIAALPCLPLAADPDGKVMAMAPARIGQVARAARALIQDQWNYHDLNCRRLEKLNHRLDGFSLLLIGLAFLISALYLVIWALHTPDTHGLWPWHVPHWHWVERAYAFFKVAAAYCGAVFPALAAAAAGIRFQGDFERFAMRSKDTAKQLEALRERADALALRAQACGAAPSTGQPPLYEPLLDLLLDTQAALDEDLADWRFAYAARPLVFG